MVVTRRRFIFGGLATVGALTAYAAGYEPRHIEVRKVTIPLGKPLAHPITVLHISDLHWSQVVSLDHIGHAIALGLQEKPDLICLTGDYLTAGSKYDFREYVPVLETLSATAPCFACFGNHDGRLYPIGLQATGAHRKPGTLLMREVFHAARIQVLENEAVEVTIRGTRLFIAGGADLWSHRLDVEATLRSTGGEHLSPIIVLAHNPDSKHQFKYHRWDLMLCGHTHGGQVVMPFFGPLYLPVSDRNYVDGLYQWEGRPLFITRGAGNLLGVRFNCPPEVSILQLTGPVSAQFQV